MCPQSSARDSAPALCNSNCASCGILESSAWISFRATLRFSPSVGAVWVPAIPHPPWAWLPCQSEWAAATCWSSSTPCASWNETWNSLWATEPPGHQPTLSSAASWSLTTVSSGSLSLAVRSWTDSCCCCRSCCSCCCSCCCCFCSCCCSCCSCCCCCCCFCCCCCCCCCFCCCCCCCCCFCCCCCCRSFPVAGYPSPRALGV